MGTKRSDCKEVKPEKKCQKSAKSGGDSLTFGLGMVLNVCMHYVWCC